MKTPEVVRIISELSELDKAVQFLYEKCKMLNDECNNLKQENSQLKEKLAQSNS